MGTGTMLERLDAAYDDGRYAEVIQLYEAMRERAEADAVAHTLGAGSYLAQGNLPAAQAAIGAALMSPAEWPVRGHILFSAAMIASEAGQLSQVIEYLDIVISADGHPKAAPALFCRALALRELGTYGVAVEYYRRAAAAYEAQGVPDMVCASHQNAAWAQCLAGNAGGAADALAMARPLIGDDHARYHQQVGELFLALLEGSFPVAPAQVLAMNTAAPQGVRCHAAMLLARNYGNGDVEQARLWIDQATALAEDLHPRYMRDVAKVRERIDQL